MGQFKLETQYHEIMKLKMLTIHHYCGPCHFQVLTTLIFAVSSNFGDIHIVSTFLKSTMVARNKKCIFEKDNHDYTV